MTDTDTPDEPVHAGPCPECGQMVQYVDDGDGGVEYREIRSLVRGAAYDLLDACKAITDAIDPDSGYADKSAAVKAARQAEDAIGKAEGR